MARPRSFSSARVVAAAKDVFWAKGYRRTAIEDLERGTRLNRSSLYLAFGTKQALFDQALDAYDDEVITPYLASMARPGADSKEIEAFFLALASRFRKGGQSARRGCLLINSIAELEGHLPELHGRAVGYRDRLHRALANALAGSFGGTSRRSIARRADALTATTLGAWLLARIDPANAARTCTAVAAEVGSWRKGGMNKKEGSTVPLR